MFDVDAAVKALKELEKAYLPAQPGWCALRAILEAGRVEEKKTKPECDGSFCRFCGPMKCICDGYGNEVNPDDGTVKIDRKHIPSIMKCLAIDIRDNYDPKVNDAYNELRSKIGR